MKERHLFVVCSPLQLVNAYEVLKQKVSSAQSVLIVYLRRHDDRAILQMKNTLEYQDWNYIYFIEDSYFLSITYCKATCLCLFINYKFSFFETASFGDISQPLKLFMLNMIHLKQAYMLDEGSASLCTTLLNYLESARENMSGFICKDFLYKRWIKNIHSIGIISFFDSPFLTAKGTHAFEATKNLCKKLPLSKHGCYFFGIALYNAGLSYEEYIYLLRQIRAYFHDKKLYYVPHRHTNFIKEEEIAQITGFIFIAPSLPAEYLFLDLNINPEIIATFCSTAAFTLKKIFPDSQFVSFALPHYLMNKVHRKEGKQIIYEKLEKISQRIYLE